MKKQYISIVLLLTVLILSGCSNTNDSSNSGDLAKTTSNVSGNDVVLPELLESDLIKQDEFTEGVWIKRYPDNTACFKFETPEGIKIITDPFGMNETVHTDIVTESHQDFDHVDVSMLETPYELINSTGEFNVKGINITGFPGKHNMGDGDVTNIIYVFNINDITIAHFASQGELPSEDTLDQIGEVDILLIQVFPDNSFMKLTMEDFDAIIGKLSPKIVISEHGSSTAGTSMAQSVNTVAEYAESGEIVVTRSILDDIEGIKIIDLYHELSK